MRLISFVFIIYFAFTLTVSAQTEAAQQFFKDGMQSATAQNFQTALEFYKQAEAENSSGIKTFSAKIQYNIGVCYYQLNRQTKAIESFTKAINLSGETYQKAFYALGMAETDLKHFDKAETAFLAAIRLSERDGEAWFDLAIVWTIAKNYDKAQKAFANAIKYNSVSKSASYNNLGVIFALTRNFQAAESQFKRALFESGGKLIEAQNNLKLCRLRLQEKDINLLAQLEFSGSNYKNQ
jgi:tetratricopeptide (TPR) repeat protein